MQCSSNGREMDCEYTDTFAPTRTEILEEYLARLQSRVDQLENGNVVPVGHSQAPATSEYIVKH